MSAKVISMCNQKGGVGKTTLVSKWRTCFVAYSLAKMGNKVLLIDFDPQADLTTLMVKTKSQKSDEILSFNKTLMSAIKDNESLDNVTVQVMDNLYLVPTASDFYLYPRYLEHAYLNEKERVASFKNKLSDIKDKYDYIFIDVSPTLSLQNDTALYACDELVIVLQTQQRAFDDAKDFIEYIQDDIIDEYIADTEVLAVVPVLSKDNAKVDQLILEKSREEWGADVFNSHIRIMERAKNYDVTGITEDRDAWDKKTLNVYKEVAVELLGRIKEAHE